MSDSVPTGWKVKTVNSISRKVGSGVTPKGGSKVYSSSGIKFIRSQNVHFSGLSLEDIVYISAEIHSSMVGSHVRDGDVLLNITGASIGRCSYVPMEFGEANVNQHVCIIRPNEKVKTKYLAYWLGSDFGQHSISIFQAGGNREGLNFQQIRSIPVNLPPLPEQQKIAAILSSVDDVIEKTRAQIDKLKDLKTGMMQELLTKGIGHTAFKDSPVGRIPEGWGFAPLDSVATVQTGVAKNSKATGDLIEVPYLRVANVQDGFLDLSEIKTIRIDSSRLERFSLMNEDVLVNEGGDFDKLGRGAVWDNQISPCVHQNHVFVVRTKKDQLLPRFFNYLSGSQHGKKYYLGCAKQTTNLASLNSTQLKGFPVLLPPVSEQKEICDILSSIDRRIALAESRKIASESLKRSLMQDLLTGKVRVNVDNKENAVA